ncbi:tripartite tricarboxylate transporter substrate binding protein [Orrella sp. JC864]|uniref:tripartite tricarboxylate transporter substrate binding protein n=1 Tax=Orrella sp. JC864 TaxID=3120298 RepID=UPI003008E494
MFLQRSLRAALAVMTLAAAGTALPAAAADYPSRPISIIVPYPAGGGADQAARTLATMLEKELGQPVNVVNRGGGAAVPGTMAVSKARPDGYTLGVITSDISLYKPQGLADLSYEDVTPISQTTQIAAGVNVVANAPYKTMQDLMQAIKDQPGQLKATGAAPGVNWHVAFLGLMMDQGLDPATVIWVPTQGGTAGHLDVAAGNSTFSTASMAEARALIEAGKIRPLAVMADTRLEMFPDVPTLKEAVGSEWTYALWHGLVGPKDLPEDVMARLAPAIQKVVQSDAFKQSLQERGFQVVGRAGDEFRDFMAADLKTMTEVLGQIKK